MRPHVLIADGSPGMGGAITSAAGLAYTLVRHGFQVEFSLASSEARAALVAELPRAFGSHPVRHVVHGLMRPAGLDAASGLSYLMRELGRFASTLTASGRPDLIIGNNGPEVNAGVAAAARARRIPYIQYTRSIPWLGSIGRRTLQHAAASISVGADVAAKLRRAGFATDIAIEGLTPGQWPTRRSEFADRWLWVAALAEWKGLGLMLDAYSDLEERPNLDVAYALLPKASTSHTPAPTNSPRGSTLLERPNLDHLRRRALAYIHTSLRPEPFGRTIVEAMAAGLCAVVPDSGSGPFLVDHGRTGFIYETGSKASLANALRMLREDPARAREMGDNAANQALRYTAENAFGPIAELVHEVLRAEYRRVPRLLHSLVPAST